MTYPADVCAELNADMDRDNLRSCHQCLSCVKHNNSCLIDPTFPVMDCVEYQPNKEQA